MWFDILPINCQSLFYWTNNCRVIFCRIWNKNVSISCLNGDSFDVWKSMHPYFTDDLCNKFHVVKQLFTIVVIYIGAIYTCLSLEAFMKIWCNFIFRNERTPLFGSFVSCYVCLCEFLYIWWRLWSCNNNELGYLCSATRRVKWSPQ